MLPTETDNSQSEPCDERSKHHCISALQNKWLNNRGGRVCSAQSLEATVVSDYETKLNFPVISIYECLEGILDNLDQTAVGK